MFRKYFNRGIGLLILAFLALVVSLQATGVIKKYMQEQVPNVQETIHPLEIDGLHVRSVATTDTQRLTCRVSRFYHHTLSTHIY